MNFKRSIIAISALVLSGARPSWSGSLDPTNAPGPSMYTIEDVYRALAGTALETKIGLNNTNTPAATMHTIEELYQLAVTVANGSGAASVRKTGVTISYTVGDDGYYQKGTAWPTQVFTVGSGSASNCVTDNRTGLMWVKNPSGTPRVWSNALAYCEALDGSSGRGGYTDWRMPNAREMLSIFDYSGPGGITLPLNHPFVGIVPSGVYVWTSTSMGWDPAHNYCWVPNTAESIMTFYNGKSDTNCYVWAIRGGN